MIPIVVLVGRPNVGKSTLFNRLVGRRCAIVEGTPGVTRDRLYGEAEWRGRRYRVVDTGGLQLGGGTRLQRAVEEQAHRAMQEARLVLWVVDGREGPTPQDALAAERVRLHGAPWLCVVNKIDEVSLVPLAFQFSRLAGDRVVAVSAEHGYGIDDLLDQIEGLVPGSDETPSREPNVSGGAGEALKIALVGRPNVGKSSLLNALSGESRAVVDAQAGTTRDTVDTLVEHHGRVLRILDTAGIRRKNRTDEKLEKFCILRALRTLEEADVAVLVLDAVDDVTDQDQTIARYIVQRGRAAVIAANKWDRVAKRERSIRLRGLAGALPGLPFAVLVPVSAVRREGLEDLLNAVVRSAQAWSRRFTTSALNRFLKGAVRSFQPPLYRNVPVHLNYITQTGQCPPRLTVFANRPDGVSPEYRRYLVRTFRERFRLEGTPVEVSIRAKR